MTHNIDGFKEHYEHIVTKPFYRKYNGKITVDNYVKIIAETEKAILIRERIQKDKELYSTSPMWISKSLILERKIHNGNECRFNHYK